MDLRRLATLIVFVVVAAVVSGADAQRISATLEPEQIAVGEAAYINIKIRGTQGIATPEFPEVDGLRFQHAGTSQNIRTSIVNGRQNIIMEKGFRVAVIPERPGTFTVPPLKGNSDGTDVETPVFTLRVVPGTIKAPDKAPGGFASPPGVQQGQEITDLPEEAAFLRIEFGEGNRDFLYVGEFVPVAVKAYFREGVRAELRGTPTLQDEGFLLKNLSDEVQRNEERHGGHRFIVATWYAGLAAIKTGTFDATVSLDVAVAVPSRQRSRSLFGMFADPYDRKEVTLDTLEEGVEVRPLPSEGKPPGFAGAVGEFEITTFEIPATMEAGEPETLQVTVKGKGNFDRVESPLLVPEDLWKLYPSQDQFVPGDAVQFSGEKRFEIPVVPQRPGTYEAAFSFPYFNPLKGAYDVAKGDVVALAVTGEAVPGAELSVAESGGDSASDGPALAPIKLSPGVLGVSMQPLASRPWFLWGLLLPVAVMGLAAVARWRKDRAEAPEVVRLRELQKAVERGLRSVDEAVVAGDPAGFFRASRSVLQQHFGQRWGVEPGSVTTDDVRDRSPEDTAAIEVFAAADETEYSGSAPATADLTGLAGKVKSLVEGVAK